MGTRLAHELQALLRDGKQVWLFLDYDGTLADFAPTPDDIIPDSQLIGLLTRLSEVPRLRMAVVSGRRLDHIRSLIPVPGIILAGTYGIELMLPDEGLVHLAAIDALRPALDRLKPRWAGLITGREGFYLEDKGWALALHALFASDQEASMTLAEGLQAAVDVLDEFGPDGPMQVVGGQRFLEVGSKLADKGQAVEELLKRLPLPGARLVYIGDDDKDEKAFAAIHKHGGAAILVASTPRQTLADSRLGSPVEVRRWLESILV